MTGQQTRARLGERARRLPLWAAQRALLSCAVGLWSGLLLWPSPWFLLPLACLWMSWGLAWLPGEEGVEAWRFLRAGLAVAGLAGLGRFLAPGLGLVDWAQAGLNWLGWACAVAMLLLQSLAGGRKGDPLRQRWSATGIPWLAAARWGLLGSWLLLFSAESRLTPAQQRLLSAATLLVGAETLLWAAWERGAMPGGLRWLGRGPAWASLTGGLVWGGRLLPAVLLLLTASRESVYLALVGWVLLWLGDGLGYVLLQHAPPPGQGEQAWPTPTRG